MEEKSPEVPTRDQLKLVHRRGYETVVRSDGSVVHRKTGQRPKKPPRFSRAQLARAQASLDAGVKVGTVAAQLGVKTSTTLHAWLKKYHEQPQLWDHPKAPVGIPGEDAVPRTDAVLPAGVEPTPAAGGAGGLPGL